jgi:hypothetical protein
LAGGYLNLRSYLGNRPTDQLDVWGEKMEYPPKPEEVKVTEVPKGDSSLQGEERAFFSGKGDIPNRNYEYDENGSMTAPTAIYATEIFVVKGKRSEKDEAGNTMEEHERLHARYFYEAHKQIADELNKLETANTRCPKKCQVLAKAYIATVLSYYRMRLAYQNAELHNRTYSYQSLRKEFYQSDSNVRGEVYRTNVGNEKYRAPEEDGFPPHLQRMVGISGNKELYLDELRRHHKDKILDDYTDKIEKLDGQKQQALTKFKECLAK